MKVKILALIIFLALVAWGLWAIVQRIVPENQTLPIPDITIEQTSGFTTSSPQVLPCDLSGNCLGKG